ncbi:MAG: hypothetical protein JWN34_1837, partial [Bryobacterales bacterium]|nr:hypothetical protein [Bryobacterales bacterium]
ERTIAIESGDRLILFSDGVSEATRQGEVHGDDDRWVVDYVRRLATSPGLAESLAMAAVSDDDVSVLDLRFQ